MASTKISALPAASTLTGAETIPLVQGGVTKKVTTDQFLTAANPSYTGTLTGGTGVVNLGSGQFVKDASGNLGLGVTPVSGGGTLQLSNGQSITFQGTFGSLVTNASYTDDWRYITNAGAAWYYQNAGSHVWNTAPSGTAGNPISFTQAMTLDASGNLGIGNTTPVSKLDVLASGGVNSLHLGAIANTDFGGYLNSSGDSEVLLSGGANYNSYSAPDFVMTAKATVASGIGCRNGMVNFWTNTGLTAGTTFNQSVKATIDASGNLIQTVNTTAATLSTNGTLTFSIVDNSTLRVSVRGSDGTTRTATLALT
jgi:hypothetical protein